MPLSRHRVGIYQETSSHATRQGTLGHRRLSSLSHGREEKATTRPEGEGWGGGLPGTGINSWETLISTEVNVVVI